MPRILRTIKCAITCLLVELADPTARSINSDDVATANPEKIKLNSNVNSLLKCMLAKRQKKYVQIHANKL